MSYWVTNCSNLHRAFILPYLLATIMLQWVAPIRAPTYLRFLQRSPRRQCFSTSRFEELLPQIPLEDVRNFCFIAHVDHGKSSLSSRLLEHTGNLKNEDKEKIDALDRLLVEQKRGITVKATTATMLHPHPSAKGPTGHLLLNMYDTPGHVDFGREVTRSLSFVQGAILLLDATQGMQAQTWSVYEKAKALDPSPEILIALTKTDLESARPMHVALTVSEWLEGYDPDDILVTSARNRVGITELIDRICSRVPAPQPLEDDDGSILRAQVVDSWYDDRGVNCLVQLLSGYMSEGDRIAIASKDTPYSVQEVGILLPHALRTRKLQRGQMGYVRFGLKDPRQALPGTILVWHKHANRSMILPTLPSSVDTKSVLYASVHPEDVDGFEDLSNAVERLALNDTGLEVQRTASLGGEGGGPFLGPGLRVGFQGLLHVEVFRQRLLDEFDIEAVVTPPKVPYHITELPSKRNNLLEPVTRTIEDLSEWPPHGSRVQVQEPMVQARIVARVEDAGAVMELLQRHRATQLQTIPLDDEKWMFTARVPWGEVVIDFHDKLKNVTAGYGSMDTTEDGWSEASLCKVEILLNGEIVEPLAFVCHRDNAQSEGRKVAQRLQEVLPRQQFVTVIQAKADGKVIAAERIKAYRKDVLTKSGKTVGGGDMTRKKKLLEKQKKGKKRMQTDGRVTLSQEAFNSVISR